MPFRRVAHAALLVAVVACQADDAPESAVGPGLPVPALLERLHDRNADGELPVLDELAPAPAVDVTPVRNRHDPSATDTLRTYRYDGLALTVHHVGGSGKEIVSRVTVTDAGYETGLGVAVGDHRADALAALGEPVGTRPDTLLWDLGRAPDDPTPVRLVVSFGPDDRVASIAWTFYVD